MTRALPFFTIAVLAAATDASAGLPTCHKSRTIETMSRVDAHTFRLCWQSPDACFALDVNAKTLAWMPVIKPRPAADVADNLPGVTVGMTVTLCDDKGKDCRDYVTPPEPVSAYAPTFAFANADRSRIAAVTESAVTLFDGAGKKLGTIASWKQGESVVWSFDAAWFFGDRVYLQMHEGRLTEKRVFDLTGKLVADLGSTAEGAIHLADGTVAIVSRNGEVVDLRDKAGARKKRVEVFGSSSTHEASEVALAADGRIAVALEDGSVTLVDVANGNRTVVDPPKACP